MKGSNENFTNNIPLYYRSQMSQQYKQEEKNLPNIINNFISPSHDRPLLSTARAPNPGNCSSKTTSTETQAIATLYTNILAPWTGVIPPKYIYNHFPKAENDSTHTNGGIRTNQQTVHQRKIKTVQILEHSKVI